MTRPPHNHGLGLKHAPTVTQVSWRTGRHRTAGASASPFLVWCGERTLSRAMTSAAEGQRGLLDGGSATDATRGASRGLAGGGSRGQLDDLRRIVDGCVADRVERRGREPQGAPEPRSEEHTSELQSLMRISYAVFCLKKNKIMRNT